MGLTSCSVTTNYISQLDDQPNDIGGLTAEQLKQKFDQAGTDIKTWLNETLIPEIEATFDVKNNWKSWTPTLTWAGGTPVVSTVQARYTTGGYACKGYVVIDISDGNGATALNISLPVAVKDDAPPNLPAYGEEYLSVGGASNPIPYLNRNDSTLRFRTLATIADGIGAQIRVWFEYPI
jgi:hypothetical protein